MNTRPNPISEFAQDLYDVLGMNTNFMTQKEFYNKYVDEDHALIREALHGHHEAEIFSRKILAQILEPAGEHGVSVCPLDYVDDIYVPVAEFEPQKFYPITLIRYWMGRLEVFVSDYEETEDKGWRILPDGHWEDYVEAKVDTWFMLDCVAANLEYADGYSD